MKTPSYDGQLDPMLGHVFAGTYQVVKLLGRGGSGTVYEATHLRLPKRVAIKVLRQSGLATADGVERFRREAEILSSLGNRHITEVYDFNSMPDGTPYMVMELLEGEDLGVRIRRMGKLPAPEALEIAGQIVSALTAAHRQLVVHRDIKPENIFLCASQDEPFVVKLLDFGLSKMRTSGMMTLTQSESFLGTPAYVSPEQASGETKRVDHRSDVYSLGAVLYEALTGKLPFEAPSVYALLIKVMREMPAPVTTLVPDLPKELDGVLRKAMAKEPDDRFASVGDLWAALQKAFVNSKIAMRRMTGTQQNLKRVSKAPKLLLKSVPAPPSIKQEIPKSLLAKTEVSGEIDDADPTQVRRQRQASHQVDDTNPDIGHIPTVQPTKLPRRTHTTEGHAHREPISWPKVDEGTTLLPRSPFSRPTYRWIGLGVAFIAIVASVGLLLFQGDDDKAPAPSHPHQRSSVGARESIGHVASPAPPPPTAPAAVAVPSKEAPATTTPTPSSFMGNGVVRGQDDPDKSGATLGAGAKDLRSFLNNFHKSVGPTAGTGTTADEPAHPPARTKRSRKK